jgi:hypothetical protein
LVLKFSAWLKQAAFSGRLNMRLDN